MLKNISNSINVLEFECQAPLRFFERCSKCARFGDDCPDLALGKEILGRKKKIAYSDGPDEDGVHISVFNCMAPVYYFERTRKKCGHGGRCREEGLLLALLNGKKTLDYSHKEVTELPRVRRRKITRPVQTRAEKFAVS